MVWIIMKSAGDDHSFFAMEVPGEAGHTRQFARQLAESVTQRLAEVETTKKLLAEAVALLTEAETSIAFDEADRAESWPKENLDLDLGQRVADFIKKAGELQRG